MTRSITPRNQDTALRVVNFLRQHPECHEQEAFWTALTAGERVEDIRAQDFPWKQRKATVCLATLTAIYTAPEGTVLGFSTITLPGGRDVPVSLWAQSYYGMSRDSRYAIFFCFGNTEALRRLEEWALLTSPPVEENCGSGVPHLSHSIAGGYTLCPGTALAQAGEEEVLLP